MPICSGNLHARHDTLNAVPRLTARRRVAAVFATFIAAMFGLAAGAVWMLPTMWLQRPLPWLAVPLGLALAWAIRGWLRPAGAMAALLAAMATLLAAAYVSGLTAAARIAGMMGIGLVDALRQAGPAMLGQLARLSLSSNDVIWWLLGALTAAWFGWHRHLPRRSEHAV